MWFLKNQKDGNCHFLLRRKNTKIGRKSNCAIQLKTMYVSRLHCEIELDGNLPVLYNKSSIGTILNDKKIKTGKVLQNGDILKLNKLCDQSFSIHESKYQKISNEIIISDSEEEILTISTDDEPITKNPLKKKKTNKEWRWSTDDENPVKQYFAKKTKITSDSSENEWEKDLPFTPKMNKNYTPNSPVYKTPEHSNGINEQPINENYAPDSPIYKTPNYLKEINQHSPPLSAYAPLDYEEFATKKQPMMNSPLFEPTTPEYMKKSNKYSSNLSIYAPTTPEIIKTPKEYLLKEPKKTSTSTHSEKRKPNSISLKLSDQIDFNDCQIQ